MLEAGLLREFTARVAEKLRTELPQAGRRVVRDVQKPAIEAKPFEDILALSEGHPPTTGSEIKDLVLKPAHSPFSLKGGHNPIEAMKDQFGRLWLFKGIFQKKAPYRAVGDKVGSDLARVAGLNTPEIHYASEKLQGAVQFGTLVPLVKHSGRRLPLDPELLTKKQTDQLTASHVFRWLIGDHDGKAANFLLMEGGDVVPIDFGNMYRNFGRDRLSRTYQPNPIKPIYNTMWDAYVNGQIDLDFRAGLHQVSRIENIPDREFLQLLEPYAEARYKQPGFRPKGLETKEKFLKAALKRKQNLRTDITKFYDGLAKERGLPDLRAALLESQRAGKKTYTNLTVGA